MHARKLQFDAEHRRHLPDFDILKLFDISVDLLAIAGSDGFFKLLSPSWTALLGWSLEELYAAPFISFVHPEDAEPTLRRCEELARMGDAREHFVNRYRCRDGGYRWILWSISIQGAFYYTVARDITHLKEQEIILNETFALAQIAGWVYEPRTGEISWTSKNWRDFLPHDVAMERTFRPFDCQDLALCNVLRPTLSRAMESLKVCDEEFEIEGSEGKSRWIRILASPDVKDGAITRVTGLVQDITERKQERLAAIFAAKMASLGEMAGAIAHDINTPLAVISMRAQHAIDLLKDEGGDKDKALEFLEKIGSTVEKISAIIRGFRSFVRRCDLDEAQGVHASDIVKDTILLCEGRFAAKAVRLEIGEIAPDIVLTCRAAQISEVLLNLLSNACHAASHGAVGGWVRLSCQDQGCFVEFHVADSGEGVPEAIRSRIMEPYFTTKKVGEGTGLGLSICKKIAEYHGGTIFLDEESPHTCFILRLPKGHAKT